jgi:gliding motility-associated-like protein
VRVTFISDFSTDAGTDGAICGLDYRLNAVPPRGKGLWTKASGPGNILFNPSDTAYNANVSVDEYGTYEFQWNHTLADCFGSDLVEVIFYHQPVADAGPDQVLEYVFTTKFDAVIPSAGTGRWILESGTGRIEDENDPQSLVSGLSVGDNVFSWSVSNGVCEVVADQVIITVHDLITPTIITPNNDGENDYLVFPGVELQSDSEIIIYNRWGTEVYRSNNYQNDWDGRDHKGRELIRDTYYYVLKIGNQRLIKSFVEIRR